MQRSWLPVIAATLFVLAAGLVSAQIASDDQPDLEAANLSWSPQEPQHGDAVLLSADVENDGHADAGAFNVTFTLDDELIGQARVEDLAANQSVHVNASTDALEAGTYEIALDVDADDEVDEADEDNRETAQFTVTHPRDDRPNAGENPREDRPGSDDRSDRAPAWDENRTEDRAPNQAREPRMAGSQWSHENGTFTGQHVAFALDEDAPAIRNYTLVANDTRVFDEIHLDADEADWRAHGSMFELRTNDSLVRILDTPSAVVTVDTLNATVHMTPDEDVNATLADDEEHDWDRRVYTLNLTEDRRSWLAGANLTLEDGFFEVTERASHRALPANADRSDTDEREARGPPDDAGPPEGVPAKAHPMSDQARENVQRALSQGDVGVEVHVGENQTQPVGVEMNHVQIKQAHADPQGPVKANVTVAAPHGSPGTVVTVNLDAATVGNLTVDEAAQRLEVRMDGAPVEPADDLQHALDWRSHEEPHALLLVGQDGVQALVSVPSFSEHTIEVTEASTQNDQEAQQDTPALGAALATGTALLTAHALARKED